MDYFSAGLVALAGSANSHPWHCATHPSGRGKEEKEKGTWQGENDESWTGITAAVVPPRLWSSAQHQAKAPLTLLLTSAQRQVNGSFSKTSTTACWLKQKQPKQNLKHYLMWNSPSPRPGSVSPCGHANSCASIGKPEAEERGKYCGPKL